MTAMEKGMRELRAKERERIAALEREKAAIRENLLACMLEDLCSKPEIVYSESTTADTLFTMVH